MAAARRQFVGGIAGLGAAFALGGTSLSMLSAYSGESGSAAPVESFPPPDPGSPWWMQGVYAPVGHEVEAHDLTVRGAIPPELSGWFLRNGSNPVNGDSEHWSRGVDRPPTAGSGRFPWRMDGRRVNR